MSAIYLAKTNQKLNFARLHLEALKAAHTVNSWSRHALIESYQESVLFHLSSAYLALLREIAERYRFEAQQIETIEDLRSRFEEAGLESPELMRLEQLEGDASSWLHKLQKAYAACWMAVDKPQRATAPDDSLSEIHVMQINPDHAEDEQVHAEYVAWLNALRSLAEQLREGMQEW